jgi:hypothetical protein
VGNKKRTKREKLGLPKTPSNPYSKKLKLIDSIVVGASIDGYCDDARDFVFFRIGGSVYVLVAEMVFKYLPKEEVKFIYKENMYSQELQESIFNKGGIHSNWMAYGWEELEEFERLGVEGIKKAIVDTVLEDEAEFNNYMQEENNFVPTDFAEEFVCMDEKVRSMFLSLIDLKGLVEELESTKVVEIDEEYYRMPTSGGIVIDGEFYSEEDRQQMDYWMANGNWESVWEMQGLNDVDNEKKKRAKHPGDIFNQETHEKNLKVHDLAHLVYREKRKVIGKMPDKEQVNEMKAELVKRAAEKGYSITLGQAKHYYEYNIKNLEKSYKKSFKDK